VKQAFAFNGSVPGPVIRVNEGDRVRMIVQNDLPVATAVHWHGMVLPNDQDGVPHLTQHPIEPGKTFVYEWKAIATGTHWYHSHSSGKDIGRGLYGTLEVVPRVGDLRTDRDYRLMIGDTNLGFVLNGRSFPATVALKAQVGERVRIRLIGTGEDSHPIHLHGSPFRVIAQDGLRLPQPQWMDTLLVSPGQTFDLLVVPQTPGRWLLHCHIFAHSETERAMLGLVTILDVEKSSLPVSPLDKGPAP
jgi:FtsP/CotA-like multicopper oxidase with cupredoxin domain